MQWLKSNAAIETDKGEWRDGRQSGKGIQTWPTGRYEGELADGEPNGKNCRMEQQCHWQNFKKICVWVKVCR